MSGAPSFSSFLYQEGGGALGKPPSVGLDEQASFKAPEQPFKGQAAENISTGVWGGQDIVSSFSEGLNNRVHIASNGLADKQLNKTGEYLPKISNLGFDINKTKQSGQSR